MDQATNETTLATIIPKIEADRNQLMQSLQTINVVDEPSCQIATEAMVSIKARVKRLEELRKKFTQPLFDQQKLIKKEFDDQAKPFHDLLETLNTQVKSYLMAQQEQALAAQRARYEEIKKAEAQRVEAQPKSFAPPTATPAPAPVEVITPAPVEMPANSIKTTGGSVSKRSIWKWEVQDMVALANARPDLFILDEKKLNQEVKSGLRELSGVRIYWEVQDMVALANARPDLFILDEKKLNQEVKSGLRELSGVRIY